MGMALNALKGTPLSSTKPQKTSLIIGTRGSPLALWQARMVAERLRGLDALSDVPIEIKVLKTTGDAIKGHLSEFGGKGLFTRELEDALLGARIDIAVHSMKDVPTVGHEDLTVAAILPREDPRDAFISPSVASINELPQGAVVGSASIRRRAQLARIRPDIKFVLLRGNVGTRLEKLSKGECDATFLAYAGLKRLGQEDVVSQIIPTQMMLPAPAQGAVGIEVHRGNARALTAVAALDDYDSRLAITVERAFLRALDGSCRTPIAALAEIKNGQIEFRGEVLSKDGTLYFNCQDSLALSGVDDAQKLAYDFGLRLGQKVRDDIGGRIVWDE